MVEPTPTVTKPPVDTSKQLGVQSPTPKPIAKPITKPFPKNDK